MRSLSFTISAADPGRLFPNVLPWLLAILGIAFAGAIVIWIVRRALRSDSGSDSQGFTLHSLRELRDQGQISNEEYEKAREALITRVKRDAEKPPANDTNSIATPPNERNESTAGESHIDKPPNADKSAS